MKLNTRKKQAISKLLSLLTLGTVGANVQIPSTMAAIENKGTKENSAAGENAQKLGQGELTADNLAGYLCYCDVEISTNTSCKDKAVAGTDVEDCKQALKNKKVALNVLFSEYSNSGLIESAKTNKTYLVTDGDKTADAMHGEFVTNTGLGDLIIPKDRKDGSGNVKWLTNVNVKQTGKPNKGVYQLITSGKKTHARKVNSEVDALATGLLALKVDSKDAALAMLNETVVLKPDGNLKQGDAVAGEYVVPKGFENLDKGLWNELKTYLRPIATVAADEILRAGLDPTGCTGNEEALSGIEVNPRLRIVKANPVPTAGENNPELGKKLLENLKKLESAYDSIAASGTPTGLARTKSYNVKECILALTALQTLGYNSAEGKAMYKMLSANGALESVEQIAKYMAVQMLATVPDEILKEEYSYKDSVHNLEMLSQYAGDASVLKSDKVTDLLKGANDKISELSSELDAWRILTPNSDKYNTALNAIKAHAYGGKTKQEIENEAKADQADTDKALLGGITPADAAAKIKTLQDAQIGTGTKVGALGGALAAGGLMGYALQRALGGQKAQTSNAKNALTSKTPTNNKTAPKLQTKTTPNR